MSEDEKIREVVDEFRKFREFVRRSIQELEAVELDAHREMCRRLEDIKAECSNSLDVRGQPASAALE